MIPDYYQYGSLDFFPFLSQASPLLFEAADKFLVFLLGFVIFFLQKPQEFLFFSFHYGEVVISEFARLLFDTSMYLLPFTFQYIFIHGCPPFDVSECLFINKTKIQKYGLPVVPGKRVPCTLSCQCSTQAGSLRLRSGLQEGAKTEAP